MSTLYPRVIAIHRPAAQAQGGVQTTYAADRVTSETVLFMDIPANIQGRREGQRDTVQLPGGATVSVWYVFIPKSAVPLGSIMDRDIIVDELGERRQVIQNYWNSRGYRLTCHKLEA